MPCFVLPIAATNRVESPLPSLQVGGRLIRDGSVQVSWRHALPPSRDLFLVQCAHRVNA